jgi:hypothetical protein
LEKLCVAVHNYDIKRELADLNVKIARESCLYLACGRCSLNNEKVIMENYEKRFNCDRDRVIKTRTCTMPPEGYLTT